ncbi:MAG: ATP-binding cassette domain-containing protein [Propionibacteriales bacterium]|nr:ATP-binding cassette domain-containing protein [Propionibacteriales bacterium]
MSYIVTTENLTKRYRDRTVVDGVDLRVPTGCVYGFLGPNGAGKSTTLKMVLSLIRPTSGAVQVLGQPMTRQTRRDLLGRIGSLIEAPPGYAHLTGAENMRLVQRLLGLEDAQVEHAVRTVRMNDQMDKKVGHYSLGMKQRLGIAMALARRPELLVLDEPSNGLDPAGIEEMRELLRGLAEDGVTVMVSSHLLGEIDKTATVLGILSGGRMIFQGTRDELFAASTPDVLLDCSAPERAQAVLSRIGPATLEGSAVRLAGPGNRAVAGAVAALVGDGIGVHGVRRDEQTLEDVFAELTSGGGL